MEPLQFEPIFDNTACHAEGCQQLYSRYVTLYGKYVAAVSANHGLVAVNKELSNHEKCRIEILEADVKVIDRKSVV